MTNEKLKIIETGTNENVSIFDSQQDNLVLQEDTTSEKINQIEIDTEDIDVLDGKTETLIIKEGYIRNGDVTDYEELVNKPQINGVELIKNKTSKQLKLQDEMKALTNMDIEKILGGI